VQQRPIFDAARLGFLVFTLFVDDAILSMRRIQFLDLFSFGFFLSGWWIANEERCVRSKCGQAAFGKFERRQQALNPLK